MAFQRKQPNSCLRGDDTAREIEKLVRQVDERMRQDAEADRPLDVNSAFLSWEAVYRLAHKSGKQDLLRSISYL